MSNQTPRERGNKLFVANDFAAAAAAYTKGLNSPLNKLVDVDERATLFCNRAACHLKLNNPVAAEADCRACLQIQPCNFKAHYRLSQALSPEHPDAVVAIATAVGLCDPGSRTAAMLETYVNIRTAASASATNAASSAASVEGNGNSSSDLPTAPPPLQLQLPADVGNVAAASDWSEVEFALRRGASFVVLRPGTYTTHNLMPLPARGVAAYTLCAIGNVVLKNSDGHAVWVNGDLPFSSYKQLRVTLVGMRLVGNGRGAAACVSGDGTSLQLLHCRVEDYSEVGVLVSGRCTAQMSLCTFKSTTSQAIEVREGGMLVADRVAISGCYQGITAYGGARSVVLRECTILNSKSENVLLSGTYENAATEAQILPPVKLDRVQTKASRAVSLAAEEWGRKQGTQLNAVLLGCKICRAGCFGVSADKGASVIVRGCHLENNDPFAIIIKGSTDASILACRILYTGALSKSDWFRRQAAPFRMESFMRLHPAIQTKCGGINVGINYGGRVTVIGNAFSGPKSLALLEDMSTVDPKEMQASRLMGYWSRPVSEDHNSFHDSGLDMQPAEASPQSASAGGRGRARGHGAGGRRRGRGRRDNSGDGDGAHVTTASTAHVADLLPSLESLESRLPSWAIPWSGGSNEAQASMTPGPGSSGPQRRAAVVPASPLLQRTCFTCPLEAWDPTSHEYYAIGNTLGYDVTGGTAMYENQSHASKAPAQIRILLGACGDLRNLLATVYGARTAAAARHVMSGGTMDGRCSSSSSSLRLEFTLNDGNLAMLARNAVLLYMAAELEAPASAVLSVWACHGLSLEHSHLLTRALHALATSPWPQWLTASTRLERPQLDAASSPPSSPQPREVSEGVEALRNAFASWASCTMTLEILLELRRQFFGGRRGESAEELRSSAVKLSMEALQAQLGEEAAEALRQQVREYINSGSLKSDDIECDGGRRVRPEPLVEANKTLLLAPHLQYTVYFSSSIIRALPLADQSGTMTSRLIATLAPQLDAVAKGIRKGDITVHLVPGELLSVMLTAPQHHSTSPASPSPPWNKTAAAEPYNFIDCSNVADFVSLQALLLAAAPLLVRHTASRLHVESLISYKLMMHDSSLTPAEFIVKHLGPPLDTFQELTGLRFMDGETVVWPGHGVRTVWATEVEFEDGDSASAIAGAGTGRCSWLTAPRLVLDLLPACKALLQPAGRFCIVAFNGAYAAPLSLVHLLSLGVPTALVEPMVRALVRCDSTRAAALFKWELTMHAQLSARRGTEAAPLALRRLSYHAKPGWELIGCDQHPLLLAVSREALPRGPMTVCGTGGLVKQLLASFAWDQDAATAHWLMAESILQQCGGWFVTLCVTNQRTEDAEGMASTASRAGSSGGDDSGDGRGLHLLAVGVSTRLASLHGVLAEGAVAPVRWRPPVLPPALQVERETIDWLGVTPGATEEAWQGAVHVCQRARCVIVDVLVGAPLPSVELAAVTATLDGCQFIVRVKPKSGGSRSCGGIRENEFAVQMPEGHVYGKVMDIRLSRKQGLLSARIELLSS